MQKDEPLPKILYEARTADDVGLQLRWDPPGIMDFPSLERALVCIHLGDNLFGVQWAEWLDKTLPGSRGVRKVEDANLFFPEEMPDLIADECAKLWKI